MCVPCHLCNHQLVFHRNAIIHCFLSIASSALYPAFKTGAGLSWIWTVLKLNLTLFKTVKYCKYQEGHVETSRHIVVAALRREGQSLKWGTVFSLSHSLSLNFAPFLVAVHRLQLKGLWKASLQSTKTLKSYKNPDLLVITESLKDISYWRNFSNMLWWAVCSISVNMLWPYKPKCNVHLWFSCTSISE